MKKFNISLTHLRSKIQFCFILCYFMNSKFLTKKYYATKFDLATSLNFNSSSHFKFYVNDRKNANESIKTFKNLRQATRAALLT